MNTQKTNTILVAQSPPPFAACLRLIKNNDRDVLQQLAKNWFIDQKIQKALYETGDYSVQKKLAGNPSITASVQRLLLNRKQEQSGENYTLLEILANNKNISSSTQTLIFSVGDHDDNYLKQNLAHNPNITVALQNRLLKLNDDDITLNLSINKNLNILVAAKIYLQQKEHLLRQLAYHTPYNFKKIEQAINSVLQKHNLIFINLGLSMTARESLLKKYQKEVLQELSNITNKELDKEGYLKF